jgi:hypothetical protein
MAITRLAWHRGSLGLILAGCGGGAPEIKPMPPDEQGLRQFPELYRSYTKKNRHAPKPLKELSSEAIQRIGLRRAVDPWCGSR